MHADTIDEVLVQLQHIIDESIQTNDRIGYFATMYYKVTARVKEGISNNEFEDGPRMEKLDVTFANRYLEALTQWRANQPMSQSWKIAFDATKKRSVLVLQHLLLGVNAHINFDLGIATVETAGKQDVKNMKKDFNSINNIIRSLTYELINEINRVSPLLSLFGLHATNTESILIQFSIGNARDGAWCFAEDLSSKTGAEYDNLVLGRDPEITNLAGALIDPKGFIRLTIWTIHLFEWKAPGRIIRTLHDYKKKFIKVSPKTNP